MAISAPTDRRASARRRSIASRVEGIRFTEYYAGSTVCAPSRTTLMTGLHTGHAWIRGNGDIPLRPEDVTIAEMLRDAGYRTAVIGKWGLGSPGTTGMPDRQGFDHAFGFLDHRHAHRQYTDHLWRNGERAADESRARLRQRSVHRGDGCVHPERRDTRPFFVYLNYTVPHAELRAPEDSMSRRPRPVSREAVREPESRRHAHRRQPRASYARLPVAARAACCLRGDDHAHGSRHRHGSPISCARAASTATRLMMFVSDNGPHQEGGGDPGVLQELGSVAWHQARPVRRRHPRADDRELAWDHSGRPCQQPPVGALGHAADARRHRRREESLQASTVCRWRARFAARRSRRTTSCIGSFTSAAFSRPCEWDRGKRSPEKRCAARALQSRGRSGRADVMSRRPIQRSWRRSKSI